MCTRTFICCFVWSCIAGSSLPAAIVDDFSVGAVVLDGPAETVQVDLPLENVIGGKRTIEAMWTGDRVEVLSTSGLRYTSNSGYGVRLTYGGDQESLIVNPTALGDRLVLRFSDSGSPAARLAYVYINAPPTSSSNGLRFYNELSLLGDQGTIEFLLADFPGNLTNINQIIVDFARALPTGGFVLEGISIAGPPLPGDYNRDGSVDFADYEQWRHQFGRKAFQALLTADGNADRVIDAADFTIWRDSIGNGGSATVAARLVAPEPGTMLVTIGLLFIAWRPWPRTRAPRYANSGRAL